MDSRAIRHARPRHRAPAPLVRCAAAVLASLPLAASATLELPDHVIYGSATVFGTPAAIGTVIEVRTVPAGAVLARYSIGRNPRLGGQFALNIPMDAVEPRVAGRARPGDPVEIWLGAQRAGTTSVGAEGVAVRLDIDPQFLGTGPALSVDDASLAEGNSGTRLLSIPVSINTTSNVAVNVDWETVDGTATSGVACGPDVDYMWASGTAAIAAGSQATSIQVLLCGDALIEPDETFTVALDGIQNAVLATPQATATILDDDNVPTLTVADARALEPGAGSAALLFRARLSRTSAHDVLVDYQTGNATALAGLDYQAAAGTLTIPAGDLEASIAVTLLADAVVEPDEQFSLLLSNPSQATLVREASTGTIVDPAFDPAVDPRGGPTDDSVPQLVQPSGIAVSPDGDHLYATSDSGDGLLLFHRLDGEGTLQFDSFYDASVPGFTSALLDGPDDVLVSADGAHVYVASRNSDAIVAFARDGASGTLTFLANYRDGVADVSGLDGVVALALSPDGSHLYAVGRNAGAVATFSRDADTGALAFLDKELDQSAAGGDVVALAQPTALLVSPDGAQVYVASRSGNAVQTFARDADGASPDFGRLSYASVARNGLDGITGLSGASGLAISADGSHLYALGASSNTVVLFDRAADGSIAQRQQWTSGSGVPGLLGPSAIALTADGSELYVTGLDDHSLTIFARAEDGVLSVRQTVFDDQGSITTLGGPAALAVSPDDRNIYVAASLDNAIVVFLREAFTGIFGDGFGDD